MYHFVAVEYKIMKKYINKKMIEDGLMSKVIKPELSESGLIARIGDHWFFFGGTEFEYTNPKDIPFYILVEELKSFFDDIYYNKQVGSDCYTEYLYYYDYLCENI